MKTEEAILKIAEVLDVLTGNFMPDCGGDFVEYPDASPGAHEYDIHYCESCKYYYQCRRMTKAQDLNAELQSLLTDKGLMLNAAYAEGFEDADCGKRLDNPYNSARETDLFAQYNRGYFDGAV